MMITVARCPSVPVAGKALALALLVALPSMAGQAWAAWDCKAYTDFAMRDAGYAQSLGCGFTGPRWSTDEGLHYGFCTERLNVGDENALNVETSIRTSELRECYTKVFCPDYTRQAIQAVTEAAQAQCGFSGPRWSTDEGLHYGFCVDRVNAKDFNALRSETDIRRADLAQCKLASGGGGSGGGGSGGGGGGGGGRVTVKLPVELYDAPNDGRKIGEVPQGVQVVVLECADNDMCHIQGGGYSGWIYDAADYDTLDR